MADTTTNPEGPKPAADPAAAVPAESTPEPRTTASPPATGSSPTAAAGTSTAATGSVADDGDSAIDQQLSTYTASLTSSVVDYPYEHGRRYHAFRGGSYILPNDEQELDRLDLTHVLQTKIIGDRLQLAPVDFEKPLRVLDIGTGTGLWATEMADEHPNINILGNDLSPVQPQWTPPNVKFEVDDVESPWMHDAKFDYVFCRYLAACILDWPKLVGNIYSSLEPGGWAEISDFDLQYYSDDGTLTEKHQTLKWINHLLEGARMLGREPSPGPNIEGWMRDAGFTNIVAKTYKVPIGPWAKDKRLKDIGFCNLAQVLDGLEAFSLRLFCGVLKWKEEEVTVLLANVRKELKSGTVHAQFNYHAVYGQKPE
ncbi:S-adenosyl-L-methionine-dependent methyltransferase [Sarocladium strictum]